MRVITRAVLNMETMKWVSVESYDYEGAVELACGPSQQQGQIAAQEASFASMLSSNYQKNFGAQSQILQNLTNQFTPIAEAGPSQTGWSPQEAAAVNTQITEGTGNAYAQASRALGTQLSAQGGGNEYLPNGAATSLKGNLASAAANTLSQESLGATEANYNQGRQNWQQATSGLNALAGEYNPNAVGSLATGATQGAFGDATQNAMQSTQQFSAVAGGIAGLGKAAAGDATAGGFNLGGGAAPVSDVANWGGTIPLAPTSTTNSSVY